MIKLQKYTPKVYYDQSRDFQFIGRLYDMVLNSVKTNTDMIYSLPLSEDSDTKLLDLMMMTFGFKSRHEYNIKQLKSLCAAFAKVIRNKGNIDAIQYACNALVSAEGIQEEIYLDTSEDKTLITMYVPQDLSDTNLLKDLLNYILPAGMSFSITKTLKVTRESTTVIQDSTKDTDYQAYVASYKSSGVIDSASTDIISGNVKNFVGPDENDTIVDTKIISEGK